MPLDSTNWSQAETETKPDVFSLEGLIAWLETQPPAKTYDWLGNACNGGCLLDNYLFAFGYPMHTPHGPPDVNYQRLATLNGTMPYPRMDYIVAEAKPHTYGAALSRARALLASQTDAYLAETRK